MMPENTLYSGQNPLRSQLNLKDSPFDRDECMCGSPASGRALTHKTRTRPIFDQVAGHPPASVFVWRTGSLQKAMLQEDEAPPMFNSGFSSGFKTHSITNRLRMPLISWTEQMSVEVKLLDNDHKKQAILISDLHNAILAGRDKQTLTSLFEELVQNIRIHFAHEEQLLAHTAYPDAAIHKREHNNLMDRVRELQARFRYEVHTAGRVEIVNLLKGWLFSHIQSSDLEYAPHLRAQCADSMLAAVERPVELQRPAFGPQVMQRLKSA